MILISSSGMVVHLTDDSRRGAGIDEFTSARVSIPDGTVSEFTIDDATRGEAVDWIERLIGRQIAQDDAGWKEGDHPRAKSGQFSSGGSGETGSKKSSFSTVHAFKNAGMEKAVAKAGYQSSGTMEWTHPEHGGTITAKPGGYFTSSLPGKQTKTGKGSKALSDMLERGPKDVMQASVEPPIIGNHVKGSGWTSGTAPGWFMSSGPLDVQLKIEPDGSWSLYDSGKHIGSGTGQESLNAAFEGLHPRGEGGKFAAKEGGSEEVLESVSSMEYLSDKQKNLGQFLVDAGFEASPASSIFAAVFTSDTGNVVTMYPDGSWGIFDADGNELDTGFDYQSLWDKIDSGELGWLGPDSSPSASHSIAVGSPVDASGFEKVSEAKGSNPGGVYRGPDGKEYYVKTPKSADHVRNEVLAGALYSLAGANTLQYHAGVLDDKPAVVTDIQKLSTDNISGLSPYQRAEAQNDFAIHAWLANWDAVGLSGDNLGSTQDGKVINLDLGGSLLYRAQGGDKGAAFGNKADEWDSLRSSNNPQSQALFGAMTSEQLKDSAERLKGITDDQIRNLVQQHGPGDVDAKTDLADKLSKRRDDVLARAAALGQETAAQKVEQAAEAAAAQKKAAIEVAKQQATEKANAVWNQLAESQAKPTSAQAAAAKKYSGSAYTDMNNGLRYPKKYKSDAEQHSKSVAALRSWLDKTVTTEPMTLYRKVGGQYAEILGSVIEKGCTFIDPAFGSTSPSPGVWGGSMTWEIHAPAGSKAASLRDYSKHPGEVEVLLQAGSRFHVDEWDHENNHLKVTLVNT